MEEIGSQRWAERALVIHKTPMGVKAHHNGEPRDMNRDWRFIGSGSARSVYLHKPTNVAYKVGRYGNTYQSRNELANVTGIRELPLVTRDGWKITAPAMTGYTVGKDLVVATEFMGEPTGEEGSKWAAFYKGHATAINRWEEKTPGAGDMFGVNLRVDESKRIWYVVDAGL